MARKGRRKRSRKGKKVKVTVEEEEEEPVEEEEIIEAEEVLDDDTEADVLEEAESDEDEEPESEDLVEDDFVQDQDTEDGSQEEDIVEDVIEEEPEDIEDVEDDDDLEEEEVALDDIEDEPEEEIEDEEDDDDLEEEEIIDDDDEDEYAEEIAESEPVERSIDGEDVWDAVEWDDLGPKSQEEVVFAEASVNDILKDLVDQAWEDGVITDDEMAMLRVLKNKLKIDNDTFDRIMEGSKPVPTAEPVEEEEIVEKEPEAPTSEPLAPAEITSDVPPMVPEMPKPPTPPAPPSGKESNMITLTTSVRGHKQPLGESFDLTQKKDNSFKKRCPHCRSLIRLDPSKGKNSCPICGKQLVEKKQDSPALRKILDQAKSAFREGDKATAEELYTIALAQSPSNKEAMFYLQKMQHKGSGVVRSTVDARNISLIKTESNRLDQLMKGGMKVGNQVLLKGPAFCGKEVLLDKIMASALKTGMPVIYVSSNRAMKEVMQGIVKQLPEFKSYNQKGLVRMYDLFSKHRDGRVLKEGHRIFNIEDREDFKKFQEDVVILLDELVRDYHGGLMIINSLSPLITQADQNDLMKFLQVLIARSKSYRFTNILDMAAGVHSESVENSIEYLMDGIIEFKELDNKNQLRLKGFRNNALTKDWVDYQHDDVDLKLIGSFMEERIL